MLNEFGLHCAWFEPELFIYDIYIYIYVHIMYIHMYILWRQVAASGGYMMACVADRLCASPFAVVGSIGVITEVLITYNI